MKTDLAILTADWHAADSKWKRLVLKLRGDSYASIYQIANISQRKHLPILLAGDIFDKKTFTADILASVMKNLRAGDASNCYYVQGNHDLSAVPWFDAFHDQFTWISGVVKLLCETKTVDFYVAGIDFINSQEGLQTALNNLELEVEKVKKESKKETKIILLLHQPCELFLGTMIETQLKHGMLPDNIDFLLLGDFHEVKNEFLLSKTGKQIPLLSPGSINMQTIAEVKDKYVHILSYEDGEFKTTPISLVTRNIYEFYNINYLNINKLFEQVEQVVKENNTEFKKLLTLSDKYDKSGSAYLESIREPIITVSYNVQDGENGKDVECELLNRCHDCYVFLNLVRVEQKEYDKVISSIETLHSNPAQSMLMFLPDVVSADEEPEVYKITADMLNSETPDMTLSNLRQKYLESGKLI